MSDVAVPGTLDGLRRELAAQWASLADGPGRRPRHLGSPAWRCASSWPARRLRAQVGPALEVHPATTGRTPEITIRVLDCAGTGTPMPTALGVARTGRAVGASAPATARRAAAVGRPPECAIADPGAGQYLVATPDARLLPWWEQGAPLRHVLAWALAPHGRRLVHAAAVGRPGRRGAPGAPSGHGKSSTAVSALLAGTTSSATTSASSPDDGAEPTRSTARSRSSPTSFPSWIPWASCDPHVIHRGTGGGPSEDKTIAVASRAAPDLMLESAPVVAIVVPSLDAPAGLEPISPATALRHLAPTSVLLLRTPGGDDLAALAEPRPAACRATRLGLLPDRAANPAALDALLDELTGPVHQGQA